MNFKVMDLSFTFLGYIDAYESFLHVRKYGESNEFTMQLSPSKEHLNLLKKDMILVNEEKSINGFHEAFQIEHLSLKDQDDAGVKLVLKGHTLGQWLGKRFTLLKDNQKGTVEEVIRTYVDKYCVNPKDTKRKIPDLMLEDLKDKNIFRKNLKTEIDYLSHYKSLKEEVETICKTNEIDYDIMVDLENKKYVFILREGLDRTVLQEVNTKAIFSRDFENVKQRDYVESVLDFKNTVLVAGAGEGAERKLLWLGEEKSGHDRYELFIDARDLSDKTENDVPIDPTKYNDMLSERGREKLKDHEHKISFDCELDVEGNLIYKKDFDLGDKASLIDKEWNLELHERITEIEESYDRDGMLLSAKFGENVPTLIKVIKREMR